jgi:hypothetical protein
MIPETCKFIYKVSKEQYLKVWKKCIFLLLQTPYILLFLTTLQPYLIILN